MRQCNAKTPHRRPWPRAWHGNWISMSRSRRSWRRKSEGSGHQMQRAPPRPSHLEKGPVRAWPFELPAGHYPKFYRSAGTLSHFFSELLIACGSAYARLVVSAVQVVPVAVALTAVPRLQCCQLVAHRLLGPCSGRRAATRQVAYTSRPAFARIPSAAARPRTEPASRVWRPAIVSRA